MDETATRLPAESNFAVRAAVGDVDGDNDLDLVVAPGGHTVRLQTNGTDTSSG